MDNKKILIVLIVIIAIAVVVAAFVMNNANSVKVDGFDFNIPEGFVENGTMVKDRENYSVDTKDGEIPCIRSVKRFDRGNDFIDIYVVEFDSPDVVKKVFDEDKVDFNATEKTIKGHDGVYVYFDDEQIHEFGYCKDKYYIAVASNNESLIEEVIK